MKHQNHQHLDLQLIDFVLPGVEVTELHGSFADAQWYSALERYHRDPKRESLVKQWTATTTWMAPGFDPNQRVVIDRTQRDANAQRLLQQWTDTVPWRVPVRPED